jgi:hypothetical protein
VKVSPTRTLSPPSHHRAWNEAEVGCSPGCKGPA